MTVTKYCIAITMFPGIASKEVYESLSIRPVRHERDSLVSLLTAGLRIDKRCNNNNIRRKELYPPMEAGLHCRRVRNQNDLDATLHTSSHLLNEAVPTVVRVDRKTNDDTENFVDKLCVTSGTFTMCLVNSIKRNLYISIDLSNMSDQKEYVEQCEGPILACLNIANNCSILESLCLHNCQLDDTCAKYISLLIMSKGNKLKSLNLSKNKITDDGARTLSDAMKSQHCTIQYFDLSQNQLSVSGVAVFAEGLSDCLYLKVLRLADSEHLVPVSVYQQFAAAIERNVVVHTLTLGSEVMDGCVKEFDNNVVVVEKKLNNDALLRCWWHDPLYTSVLDHIRNLLQQNYAGIGELICASRIDMTMIRHLLNGVTPEKQLDSCFRLLRLKPDILLASYNS